MCINKNRGRSTTAPDFLEDFAVGHLRKAVSAIFLRGSHSEHADAPQTINHASWNVCLAIDVRRIESFSQKFAQFSERIIQFGLLRSRNTGVRHDPIRNEMTLEQPLGKTKRLRTCEKQLLSLFYLFLSLRVEF